MNRDHQHWRAVETAQINWQQQTPHSDQFDDIYYSREHGLAESEHVFLAPNGLPDRWQTHPHAVFCIAETGFGTGLNFLATWQKWREQAPPQQRLHFISIEKYPLSLNDLTQALEHWPVLSALSEQLVAQYPLPLPGQHRLVFEQGHITLDLYFEDVSTAITELEPRPMVDAWYLDGFAPDKNAAMWQQSLFDAMARASRNHATVGTFTAAGFVRRGLLQAGFHMEKTNGFGRKREQLSGRLQQRPTRAKATTTPWHQLAQPAATDPSTCIVLGAGLAGCTAAAALAHRGIAVTVVDKQDTAAAASGNRQGVLYTRLSLQHSPLQDFSLASFQFAARYYQRLFAEGRLTPGRDGELCGSFHQHHNNQWLEKIAPRLTSLEALAQVVNAEKASALLGLPQSAGGLYYPASGWLHPAAVCKALLDHPLICVRNHCGTLSLNNSGEHWQLRDSQNHNVAEAGQVVIACGTDSAKLSPTHWLPLRAIRGQTTQLPAHNMPPLQTVLCHDGYIAPSVDGEHCIGASFDIDDQDLNLRSTDHQHNIDLLGKAIPAWQPQLQPLSITEMTGKVGLRCASPDYLPIAGAVPDYDQFLHRYGKLRKNARTVIDESGPYLPGLYITTAHGSRGLTSTPLAAELIASAICHEPAPLPAYLQQALAPGRFIIRNLIRNRV